MTVDMVNNLPEEPNHPPNQPEWEKHITSSDMPVLEPTLLIKVRIDPEED